MSMNETKEYLTKEKFKELEAELEHLKKTKRREVADSLEYAKSMGDLSENAEYHEAREEQAEVEDRIAKLETILKNAEIMAVQHGGSISVGSTAVVEKIKEKTRHTFTVVGSSEEADVSTGKVSHHSPIGVALIGKKKGDEFEVTTPVGSILYKITDVK